MSDEVINNAVVTITTAGRYVDYCDGCQSWVKFNLAVLNATAHYP